MTLRELIDLCDPDKMELRAFVELAGALERGEIEGSRAEVIAAMYGDETADLERAKLAAEVERIRAAAARDWAAAGQAEQFPHLR